MPRVSEAAMLDRTLSQLVARRESYLRGLSQIDALCKKYGISLERHRAQPTVSARSPRVTGNTPKRARRRRFTQTAEELILSLLKSGKRMVTSDINAGWKRSGRGGTADNTLSKMVKEKKLIRTPVKDGQGSMYAVA
ncbi:hypothetical protein BH10ACI4_BH10ACI4_38940 [soil metagenome]